MRRSEDILRFRRVRRSRNVVVSIGVATHIGAALRAAKRYAEAGELERHLQNLRSLDQNDLSVALVTQWLEEQLRSGPCRRRMAREERSAHREKPNSFRQQGDNA